jgi:hypothetical protein
LKEEKRRKQRRRQRKSRHRTLFASRSTKGHERGSVIDDVPAVEQSQASACSEISGLEE